MRALIDKQLLRLLVIGDCYFTAHLRYPDDLRSGKMTKALFKIRKLCFRLSLLLTSRLVGVVNTMNLHLFFPRSVACKSIGCDDMSPTMKLRGIIAGLKCIVIFCGFLLEIDY